MPKFDDVTNSSGGGVTRRAEARLFEWRGVSRREEARLFEWRGVSRRRQVNWRGVSSRERQVFVWRGVSPPRNGPRELRSKGKDGVNKNNFLGWRYSVNEFQ